MREVLDLKLLLFLKTIGHVPILHLLSVQPGSQVQVSGLGSHTPFTQGGIQIAGEGKNQAVHATAAPRLLNKFYSIL